MTLSVPAHLCAGGSGGHATNSTRKCPSTPACRRAPTPCERAPPCNAAGKPSSMCWVPKRDGAACNPRSGQGSPVVKGYVCVASQCVPARGLLPGALSGALGAYPGGESRPLVLAPGAVGPNGARCPATPMCRSAAGPCDAAPTCDANGRPASMCWVPKPDGEACTLGGKSGTCRARSCVV